MSWRSDSAQLIAGGWLSSAYAGHGIQSQNIPSTGTSGAGYLYNDIAAEGAAPTDEMRGEILTWPSSGTLTVNEDSSFSFTGAPDGAYTFNYRGFRNGVTYGDYTVTLTIGGESVTAGVSYDIGEIGFAISAESSVPVVTSEISYDIGQIDWAVSSSVSADANAASIAYDIGQIEFYVDAPVTAPVNSALISYDIGQVTFAVDATVTVAPSDIQAAISYDIGAISYNVAIISGTGQNLYGVGSGVVFIEPDSGVVFS